LPFDFATVLVFALAAALFVVVNLLVGRWLLRPRSTDVGHKRGTYECGEPTVGPAWIRFDVRFYTVALLFVVFDVEVVLLFPWAAVFRSFAQAGQGGLAFVEAAAFVLVLAVGLVYVWVRGDIDWTPEAGVRPRTNVDVDRPERAGRVVLPGRREGAATPLGEEGEVPCG
jgi:NADH-quinone oxidoreductase subunit A